MWKVIYKQFEWQNEFEKRRIDHPPAADILSLICMTRRLAESPDPEAEKKRRNEFLNPNHSVAVDYSFRYSLHSPPITYELKAPRQLASRVSDRFPHI